MFKGAALFALVFVGIAPQSREFLTKFFTQTSDQISASAPMSYVAIGLLVAAPLLSVIIVKSWPQRQDPQSPMAKYRRQLPFDE